MQPASAATAAPRERDAITELFNPARGAAAGTGAAHARQMQLFSPGISQFLTRSQLGLEESHRLKDGGWGHPETATRRHPRGARAEGNSTGGPGPIPSPTDGGRQPLQQASPH